MNATLQITTDIADFARRVREHLGDLPADEVDDLTDGLEADMAEAFAEDARHELPDAEAYALELRTAAGLPVRQRQRSSIGQSFGGVADSIRMKREGLAASLRKSPTMDKVLDALVELRPVWWVLRAWVAYQVAVSFSGRLDSALPYDVLSWVLLLVLVVVSVQWGRKQWLPFGWLAGLVVVGNIVAAVSLLPAIGVSNITNSPAGYEDFYYEEPVPEAMAGVSLDGKEVTNIFAYDADGKALKNVQLFDQDGLPLATSVPGGNGCLDPECTEKGVWVPSIIETGAKAWNVFPMMMALSMQDEKTGNLVPDPSAKSQERPAPFFKVPALLSQTGESTEKVEKGND